VKTGEELLQELASLKPEICSRFKAKRIGLFGSFVRGDQEEMSDVDLLVEFAEGADLLDFVGLSDFLEEQLHRRVDLATIRSLKPRFRDRVLAEVAML